MDFSKDRIAQQIEPMTRWCCTRSTDALFNDLERKFGFTIVNPDDTHQDRYAIRWGTLPILGVCHADTVLSDTSYQYNKKTKTVLCTELDDRLGLACHLLMARDLDYTILVCDHEETGGSTAQVAVGDLLQAGQFNWIFELDRRGTDVVTYEYGNDLWDGLLEDYLCPEVGGGAFSDISYLEGLGRKGFNLGIGYHQEHSHACYAKLTDTVNQLERLHNFIWSFSAVRFKHDERSGGGYSSYYGGGYSRTKTTHLSPVNQTADPYSDLYYADGIHCGGESRYVEYGGEGATSGPTWDDLKADIEQRGLGLVVDEGTDGEGMASCACCESPIPAQEVTQYGMEDVCTSCLSWLIEGGK
jgi:hypothetical protein